MATTPQQKLPSLGEIRKKTFEILGYKPCLWQCKVVEAVLKHDKDIVSIAATGSGKTLTFWMPLLFSQEGIQIVVTPLNILGEQNVQTLTKLGIKGISMTAETATKENFKVRTKLFGIPRMSNCPTMLDYIIHLIPQLLLILVHRLLRRTLQNI